MRPIKTLTVHTLTNTLLFIMSKQVMIDLLKRANNGSDLLQILDALTSDNQQAVAYAQPTADVVEF